MDCEDLVELITDHLDGALDADAEEAFERHLEECDGCERHVAQIQIVVRLLSHVDDHVEDPSSIPLLKQALRRQ